MLAGVEAAVTPAPKYDRSRRAELQRLLGDIGTVLPHQKRGTVTRRAQGWYAELTSGKIVFLGDHSLVAALTIQKLHEP